MNDPSGHWQACGDDPNGDRPCGGGGYINEDSESTNSNSSSTPNGFQITQAVTLTAYSSVGSLGSESVPEEPISIPSLQVVVINAVGEVLSIVNYIASNELKGGQDPNLWVTLTFVVDKAGYTTFSSMSILNDTGLVVFADDIQITEIGKESVNTILPYPETIISFRDQYLMSGASKTFHWDNFSKEHKSGWGTSSKPTTYNDLTGIYISATIRGFEMNGEGFGVVRPSFFIVPNNYTNSTQFQQR